MNNFYNFETSMVQNFNGLQPTDVRGTSNYNSKYQERYLWNKIYSCFDFDFGGLPFDLNTFRVLLFKYGTLGIFENANGVFFSRWRAITLNKYYNPLRVASIIGNSFFDSENVEGISDIDCVIVKCNDDYIGLNDLVRDTAVSLSLIDKAIKVASMNANVNLIAFASNKTEAETIKTAYANATEGEPLVLVNKNLKALEGDFLQPFTNHDTVSSLDKLLTARRSIINNFLTEIGISNANINKKERLVTSEVEANDDEVSANVNVWYENIKEAFDKANSIFGTNLSVKLRYNEEDKLGINDLLGGGDIV